MNEHDVALALEDRARSMPAEARSALVEAMLVAFRERGESSEDAAEACGVALDDIEHANAPAVARLVRYAEQNVGVLKEAVTFFVAEHPRLVTVLPQVVAQSVSVRRTLAP